MADEGGLGGVVLVAGDAVDEWAGAVEGGLRYWDLG